MATREEVSKKVLEVVVGQFVGQEAVTIGENDDLCALFRLDNLDRIELAMSLEEAFDIEVPDAEEEDLLEDSANLPTLNKITDYVVSKMSKLPQK